MLFTVRVRPTSTQIEGSRFPRELPCTVSKRSQGESRARRAAKLPCAKTYRYCVRENVFFSFHFCGLVAVHVRKLCRMSASFSSLDVDVLRKFVAILMETRNEKYCDVDLPAAITAVRAVDKQFHALVRETLPVRVLFRGRLSLTRGETDRDDEYAHPDLADPEGLTERLYGHLDIWPVDAQGTCKIGGWYTYSNDPWTGDHEIASAYYISGSIACGRMKLMLDFHNADGYMDDDALNASITVESVQPAQPIVDSWNRGVRRARRDFELRGGYTHTGIDSPYHPGVATLSLKALQPDAFHERTRFKWLSKSKVKEFIDNHLEDDDKIAKAKRLWQSPHPSLLNLAELEDFFGPL